MNVQDRVASAWLCMYNQHRALLYRILSWFAALAAYAWTVDKYYPENRIFEIINLGQKLATEAVR